MMIYNNIFIIINIFFKKIEIINILITSFFLYFYYILVATMSSMTMRLQSIPENSSLINRFDATNPLLSYVLERFPGNNRFCNYLLENERDIRTYKDFAFFVSLFYSREDRFISVFRSSTWAVCQEFIGNLSGDLLNYSMRRVGIWSNTVTMRMLLEDLRINFPVI